MANIMQRKFTLRERILMLVLVGILLIGLYFLLVFYPVQNRIKELETKNEELTLKEDVAKIREARYDAMKAELADIAAMDPDEVTEIPEYDNSDNVLLDVGEILKRVAGTLSDNSGKRDGNIFVRTIRLSFKISGFGNEQFESDYLKTKSVIYDLTHMKYRSQMDGLNISGSDDVTADEELIVTCTLTFYEYDPS